MADGSLYDSVYNAYVEEEALKCGLKSEEAARDALKRDLEALEPELAKETPALKAALASFSRKCTRGECCVGVAGQGWPRWATGV